MTLKSKILLTVIFLCFFISIFVFILQSINTYQQLKKTLITAAEGVLFQGENIRKNLEKLYETGFFKDTIELLKKAFEAKAGGYFFRVPKEYSHNPNNTPDKLEREILKRYQKGKIKGTYAVKRKVIDPHIPY